MLSEEVKTFVEILYLIIRYGSLRDMREFPSKRWITFGLDNHTTKLLKKWNSKRTHGVALSRTVRILRKPNERHDRRFGLKLVCSWMVDILNIGWNANCDTYSTTNWTV